MPTENPRVTITMSEDQLAEIRDYLYENKLKNQTQAILSLINKGFDAINDNRSEIPTIKKAPAIKANASLDELVANYSKLDDTGKRILCEISHAMAESRRYSVSSVENLAAARDGQRLEAVEVDDLDSLIAPESPDV